MSDLHSFFNGVCEYQHDAFVADYTNQTQSARGVEIVEQAPQDIEFFHLANPRSIPFQGVNLERNNAFFEQGNSNCECLFKSIRGRKKNWLLLVELKYCKDVQRNLSDNMDAAYSQVLNTLDTLVVKKVVSPRRVRVFLNIAAPTAGKYREPFINFLTSQDEKIELAKKRKIIVFGSNEVCVLNEGYLRQA